MADKSKIEWTDATWNPIVGCSVVSPGCTNCYAMRMAGMRLQNHPSRKGLTQLSKAGPVWTGEVRFNEEWLTQPIRWKKPRMIFVCAHGDLFHEAVPDAWIDRVFAVMALCPQHIFQVLTKRSDRMRRYMTSTLSNGNCEKERWTKAVNEVLLRSRKNWGACGSTSTAITTNRGEGALEPLMLSFRDGRLHRLVNYDPNDPQWFPVSKQFQDIVVERDGPDAYKSGFAWNLKEWPFDNLWLGVSCEDQTRANERIRHLLNTPAAVRFVSAEPLLGEIDFSNLILPNSGIPIDGLNGKYPRSGYPYTGEWDIFAQSSAPDIPPLKLDWVIVGGESGKGARPMHPDWARSIRDQCAAAGIPFFFKQWGEWLPDFERPGIDFDDDPEISRFKTCVWDSEFGRWEETNGSWDDCDSWVFADNYQEPEQPMTKVGKKIAGRRLDGIEHDGMPS